jgi:hypothetical protein
LGAGVAIAIGNVRVVDALIASGQANTPTDDLVDSAALRDAHRLADWAPYLAVAGACIVVLGVYLVRSSSRRIAVVAAVLNVLIPPWILPGAGVVLLAIARIVAVEKEARSKGAGRTAMRPRRPGRTPRRAVA